MDNEILLNIAQKYARNNFYKEEQIVFKSFSKITPIMKFEEYKKWVKHEFEHYYSIICLMCRGDENLMELQWKDDYIALLHYHQTHNKNSIKLIDDQQNILRMALAFGIYWCDYRINLHSFDVAKYDLNMDEVQYSIDYFKNVKEKFMESFKNLLDKMHTSIY
jgi:hypothetical protein